MQLALKEKFALAVSEDLTADDVTLEITPGSVNIEATVALSGAGITPGEAAESAGVVLADADTASSFLGVSVMEVGALVTPPMPPPPPYSPGFSASSSALTGAVVGGAVGGSVGGLVFVGVIVALVFYYKKNGSGSGSTKNVAITKNSEDAVVKNDLTSSKV